MSNSNAAAKAAASSHLLDPTETAERLKLSLNALRVMRGTRTGPPWCRVGVGRGVIRYPEAGLLRWIEQRTRAAQREAA